MTFYTFLLAKSRKKSIGFWCFCWFWCFWETLNHQNVKILLSLVLNCNFWLYFLILFLRFLGFCRFWPSPWRKMLLFGIFGTQDHTFLTPKMSFSCRLLALFWWFLTTFWSLLEWLFKIFWLFCDCLLIFGPWGTLKNAVWHIFDDFWWFLSFLALLNFCQNCQNLMVLLIFEFAMTVYAVFFDETFRIWWFLTQFYLLLIGF